MTGCNYPNWNLARTHLLFAKRAMGVSRTAGRLKLPGLRGGETGACGPTAPPNKAQGKRRSSGEPAFSDPPPRFAAYPQALPCLHLAPIHHGLSETFHLKLRASGSCSRFLPGSYLCLSVWLALCVCLSPGPAVSLLS